MSLSLYKVDIMYCEYLRKSDSHVMINSGIKENRPFIGIVFNIDNVDFYAPLTSPKKKHENMKNMMDFIKIGDGEYGAINLNNMIPVHKSLVTPVDCNINNNDDDSEKKYKNLLKNQLTWCNENKNNILSKAKKLYYAVTGNKVPINIKKRCCDFNLCISKMEIYCKQNNIENIKKDEYCYFDISKQEQKKINNLIVAAVENKDKKDRLIIKVRKEDYNKVKNILNNKSLIL